MVIIGNYGVTVQWNMKVWGTAVLVEEDGFDLASQAELHMHITNRKHQVSSQIPSCEVQGPKLEVMV